MTSATGMPPERRAGRQQRAARSGTVWRTRPFRTQRHPFLRVVAACSACGRTPW
jgi:hypothetical protein